MADPFSIIAGTAGLADVCLRLSKFLKQAKDGFRTVDAELEDLIDEVEYLRDINDLVKHSYTSSGKAVGSSDHEGLLDSHWQATQKTLKSCQNLVAQIESLLREVKEVGSGRHIKFDQFRRWLSQQSKEEALGTLRGRLKTHQAALQISLSAVNVIYSRATQETSGLTHSDLSKSIQDLSVDLQCKIDALEKIVGHSSERSLEPVFESAQKVVRLSYLNKHFSTPQTVSSIFTGREGELGQLRKHFNTSDLTQLPNTQRRFVIYGLAGAGKTQFCCKFASDNKQSYWGVFWVNASSKEHAEQSFSTISTIGKVAPNQAAVKSWLSSLGPEQPWLLIIDNADERDFDVEECLPDSKIGTILITTRNPMLKTLGTVGTRYFEFQGLEERQSIKLLLSAADESVPWMPTSIDLARKIAKTMGYLPLALIHAGKTILARLCTLETYLDFFDKSWSRIRRKNNSKSTMDTTDRNDTIYSTYELIHQSISSKKSQASEDALELLRVCSFLDRQHIRLDIFLRAISNPKKEERESLRQNKEKEEFRTLRPVLTWKQILRDVLVRSASLLSQLGHRPALPRFLSEVTNIGTTDEWRLRQALNELLQMSLVSTVSGPASCYSMHTAVHHWVRERPEMSLVEKAVWCQITATILSRAILLPPLGDSEEDELFRRDILPHVRHVQYLEKMIQTEFAKNRASRSPVLPTIRPTINAERLVQLVKFSLVYSQCHQMEEAEELQLTVMSYAVKFLGIENEKTINILRLLSWTYWQMARVDEAVSLQKRALEASIVVHGRASPEALKLMSSYGSSLWLQGRVSESRQIHTTAVEGLKLCLGKDHVETLKAMGGLGRAVGKDFDFTEAIDIQTEAFTGLKDKLGGSHSHTLEAMDNLAMAHFDRAAYRRGQPRDLDIALDLESEVYTLRSERFGKEHYHTLWAGLNLARIQAIRGNVEEALPLFLRGHAIIKRDLGESHFIYLFGELHHARILMCGSRYEEAEKILSGLVQIHGEKRGRHPDRLLAMFSLIKCRNVLGRGEETAGLLEELTERTKALFHANHEAVRYLLDDNTFSKDVSDVLT